MHYLYGSKAGVERRLVATFSSEQQLLAYVRWATLEQTGEPGTRQPDHPSGGALPGAGSGKFEQGSVLAGYNRWESSAEPLTADQASLVNHNPTPSML